MLGITEGVQLGLISGIVGVFSAFSVALPATISAQRTRKAVGTPNGMGNVVQMNEEVLRTVTHVKEELSALRRESERRDERLDHLNTRIDGLYERLPPGGNNYGEISRGEVEPTS